MGRFSATFVQRIKGTHRRAGVHVHRAAMMIQFSPPTIEQHLLGILRKYLRWGGSVEALAHAVNVHPTEAEVALRSMAARGLVVEKQRSDGSVWIRVQKGDQEHAASD